MNYQKKPGTQSLQAQTQLHYQSHLLNRSHKTAEEAEEAASQMIPVLHQQQPGNFPQAAQRSGPHS